MKKIITVHYTSNGVPQPGILPHIDLYVLNDNPAIPANHVVTTAPMDEIGGGWYRYDYVNYDPRLNYIFTIDGGMTLADCDRYKYGGNESYVEDITTGVLDEPILNHTTTGSVADTITKIKSDTQTILVSEASLAALIDTILKYQRNRTKIDTANAQLIIYDNDCITPLTTFNLIDFNGMPSVQEVCERVPTTC